MLLLRWRRRPEKHNVLTLRRPLPNSRAAAACAGSEADLTGLKPWVLGTLRRSVTSACRGFELSLRHGGKYLGMRYPDHRSLRAVGVARNTRNAGGVLGMMVHDESEKRLESMTRKHYERGAKQKVYGASRRQRHKRLDRTGRET